MNLATDSIRIPACARKSALKSRKAAKESITRMLKSQGVRLNAYRCNTCGMWHLTRFPK